MTASPTAAPAASTTVTSRPRALWHLAWDGATLWAWVERSLSEPLRPVRSRDAPPPHPRAVPAADVAAMLRLPRPAPAAGGPLCLALPARPAGPQAADPERLVPVPPPVFGGPAEGAFPLAPFAVPALAVPRQAAASLLFGVAAAVQGDPASPAGSLPSGPAPSTRVHRAVGTAMTGCIPLTAFWVGPAGEGDAGREAGGALVQVLAAARLPDGWRAGDWTREPSAWEEAPPPDWLQGEGPARDTLRQMIDVIRAGAEARLLALMRLEPKPGAWPASPAPQPPRAQTPAAAGPAVSDAAETARPAAIPRRPAVALAAPLAVPRALPGLEQLVGGPSARRR